MTDEILRCAQNDKNGVRDDNGALGRKFWYN